MYSRLCCRHVPCRVHHVGSLRPSAPFRVAHDKPSHCDAPRRPTHQQFAVRHEQSLKQHVPHRI